ncbi:hypothetical protein [Streptomyces violaceus]|uniref:Uncharacterized protein n=1 Tax=Streptomyces violaceus TaxID=1936 RepID=A0ABZ1NS57_STRVL
MTQRNTDVLLDVTSFISAEDFLLAQNRAAQPDDPFARQCFVEIVQSLIFMSRAYVAHPVLSNPRPEDFGERPLLLRELMRAGLAHTLQADRDQQQRAADLVDTALRDLESVHGITSMARFVEQAFTIDRTNAGSQTALSTRLSVRTRSPWNCQVSPWFTSRPGWPFSSSRYSPPGTAISRSHSLTRPDGPVNWNVAHARYGSASGISCRTCSRPSCSHAKPERRGWNQRVRRGGGPGFGADGRSAGVTGRPPASGRRGTADAEGSDTVTCPRPPICAAICFLAELPAPSSALRRAS